LCTTTSNTLPTIFLTPCTPCSIDTAASRVHPRGRVGDEARRSTHLTLPLRSGKSRFRPVTCRQYGACLQRIRDAIVCPVTMDSARSTVSLPQRGRRHSPRLVSREIAE
jgi:hypothetical protein